MSRRKITTILLLLILGMLATGCGMFGDRETVKRFENAFEQGNAPDAIRQTKRFMNMNPRNYWAKALLKKIEKKLVEEGRVALEAGQYNAAASKADLVLDKLNPRNKEARTIEAGAKKYIRLAGAKKKLAADDTIAALKLIDEALKLDPNFQEAKDLRAEANKKVEEKIAILVNTGENLFAEKKFGVLQKLANDILASVPQHPEAADWLRKAHVAILLRKKAKNLQDAQRLYDEGLYEEAKKKAEQVLKVDSKNKDAKNLVEDANDEITRPKLILSAFTRIKGMEIVTITIEKTRERFIVREGEVFGDFSVTAIDYDLKAVVVTYRKTGSQQTLTIGGQ